LFVSIQQLHLLSNSKIDLESFNIEKNSSIAEQFQYTLPILFPLLLVFAKVVKSGRIYDDGGERGAEKGREVDG